MPDPTVDHGDQELKRRRDDVEEKHRRVCQFLDATGHDAVVLGLADSVAWFTSGGELGQDLGSDHSTILLFINRTCRAVITDNVQSGRVFEEELAGPGFSTQGTSLARRLVPAHDRALPEQTRGDRPGLERVLAGPPRKRRPAESEASTDRSGAAAAPCAGSNLDPGRRGHLPQFSPRRARGRRGGTPRSSPDSGRGRPGQSLCRQRRPTGPVPQAYLQGFSHPQASRHRCYGTPAWPVRIGHPGRLIWAGRTPNSGDITP